MARSPPIVVLRLSEAHEGPAAGPHPDRVIATPPVIAVVAVAVVVGVAAWIALGVAGWSVQRRWARWKADSRS